MNLNPSRIAHHFTNGLQTPTVVSYGRAPTPKITEALDITADIYVPNGWDKSSQLPTAIFIHGVTAERGTASLMASEYTKKVMPLLRLTCHITESVCVTTILTLMVKEQELK